MAFLGLQRRSRRRLAIVVGIAIGITLFFVSSPSSYSTWRAPQSYASMKPPSGASSDSSKPTIPKSPGDTAPPPEVVLAPPPAVNPGSFDWSKRPDKHPVAEADLLRLPKGPPRQLRPIQHDFSKETPDPKLQEQQDTRRDAVKKVFVKCWGTYKKYAWAKDELSPLTLESRNTFGGWGATLVDALDTLWIMDLKDEFEEAVKAIRKIDWTKSSSRDISLFETTIRYLGGLMSAYDLSGDRSLLDKAVQLGHMLYAGFDNPQRMPVNAFNIDSAKSGKLQASSRELSAALGSLSLEFTRLAQITKEDKFFDATERVKKELERTQGQTKLPGVWPLFIDVANGFKTSESSFSLGGMADSLYEYLPKMYAMMGGLDEAYEKMHKFAAETARKHLLFRPMLPDKNDILFGSAANKYGDSISVTGANEHLTCFAGGMYALGGRLFDLPEHVAIGEKLARGCGWAYSAFPTGIMPEVSYMVACQTPDLGPCEYDESKFGSRFPKGFTSVSDSRYILRPEAIESIFILYRITGDPSYLDLAWTMFQSIQNVTATEHANSAIKDVMSKDPSGQMNQMESFWLAETLKYFYLIFSSPDLISLDEYVLNTEAHPFKIPRPA